MKINRKVLTLSMLCLLPILVLGLKQRVTEANQITVGEDSKIYDVVCPKVEIDLGNAARNCSYIDANYPDRREDIEQLYHEFSWTAFNSMIGAGDFLDATYWQKLPTDTPADCKNYSDQRLSGLIKPLWQQESLQQSIKSPPADNAIWDQAGNKVVLESYINANSRDNFISDSVNALEDINDQFGYFLGQRLRNMNWATDNSTGAINIKLAWKQLTINDVGARYYKRKIKNKAGDTLEYGLVAMHIAAKLASTSNVWMWSTFGHIDNLDGASPSFRDPSCSEADCPVNTCPIEKNGLRKTQVKRVTPISPQVKLVNQVQQEKANKRESVTQYYQLIGSQRPVNAFGFKSDKTTNIITLKNDKHAFFNDFAVPSSTLLANEIVEWDRQSESSCLGCHSQAVVWGNAEPIVKGDGVCGKAAEQGVSDTLDETQQIALFNNIENKTCEYDFLQVSEKHPNKVCMKKSKGPSECPDDLMLTRGWYAFDYTDQGESANGYIPASDLFWGLYDANKIRESQPK